MAVTLDLDFTIATTPPTTAYATWDTATATAVTLSGGNLIATNTGTTSTSQGARVADAFGKTSGKHYFEVTFTTALDGSSSNLGVGIGTIASTYAGMGNNATSGDMVFSLGAYSNGGPTGTGLGTIVSGNVIGIAVDLDLRKAWFRKSPSGQWLNVPADNPATGIGGITIPAGTMVPFVTFGGSGAVAGNVFTANFGASAFVGTVPIGFAAGWSTTVAATTTLDPRITFSRASLATYYDSAGVLKYAAHNLVWSTEDFSAGVWPKTSGGTITADVTTAPNGTTTADRLNHTAGSVSTGGGLLITSIGSPPYRIILSIHAKAGTRNFLALGTTTSTLTTYAWFNLATGTAGTKGSGLIASGMTDAGSGWWRCWIVCDATFVNWFIRVAEVNNDLNVNPAPADIYIWGAQAEQVTTETTPRAYFPNATTAIAGGPRLDYDPVTHVARGLLIEEIRTNWANYTQDFTQATYAKTGITVTADQLLAPDGTITADLLTASASPAFFASNTNTSGNYVVSFFIKKDTTDWVYIIGQSTDAPRAWFNINTGTVGTVQSGITTAGIIPIGNGWWRCWIADVGGTGFEQTALGLCDADASTAVTIGRRVYVWGAQCESPATFPTSYFPTTGGSLVRDADVAVMTGSNFSSWYNQPAGTFVLECASRTAINGTMLSANDGTINEAISFADNDGVGTLISQIFDGGSNQSSLALGTITYGTLYKVGLSFATNDIAGCLNGGTIVPDTGASLPTPNLLRIGQRNADRFVQQMHVRRIQFQNIAVSDSQLVILTTPGAWPVEGSVGAMTGAGSAAAVGTFTTAISRAGTMTGTGSATAVGRWNVERAGTMTGTGTANATGDAVIYASGEITGTGLGQALAVSAAIARSVGLMQGRGVSMSGSAFSAGEIPKGPGGTSKAMARKLKAADERRRQFERQREARLKGLVLPRPLFKPAPETVAMLHAIHDEDEEEELLLLLLGS